MRNIFNITNGIRTFNIELPLTKKLKEKLRKGENIPVNKPKTKQEG
jgi:hypothetical protein